MDSFTASDCSCYIQNVVMFFSCSHLFVDFIELSFAFQQSDIFSPQDIVMIESQQKAIVTFGSKAHAVQFAKQWNRYSSLFPLHSDRLARYDAAPVELSHSDRLARYDAAPVELSHSDSMWCHHGKDSVQQQQRFFWSQSQH